MAYHRGGGGGSRTAWMTGMNDWHRRIAWINGMDKWHG